LSSNARGEPSYAHKRIIAMDGLFSCAKSGFYPENHM